MKRIVCEFGWTDFWSPGETRAAHTSTNSIILLRPNALFFCVRSNRGLELMFLVLNRPVTHAQPDHGLANWYDSFHSIEEVIFVVEKRRAPNVLLWLWLLLRMAKRSARAPQKQWAHRMPFTRGTSGGQPRRRSTRGSEGCLVETFLTEKWTNKTTAAKRFWTQFSVSWKWRPFTWRTSCTREEDEEEDEETAIYIDHGWFLQFAVRQANNIKW